MAKLTFGDVLPAAEREQLRQWMRDTRTGRRRVRAGLPQGWDAGDKTGTSMWPGMGSLYVDIGFAQSPTGTPYAFACYFRAGEQHQNIDADAEAVLAQTGQSLARWEQ